jgi:hypothetical protein
MKKQDLYRVGSYHLLRTSRSGVFLSALSKVSSLGKIAHLVDTANLHGTTNQNHLGRYSLPGQNETLSRITSAPSMSLMAGGGIHRTASFSPGVKFQGLPQQSHQLQGFMGIPTPISSGVTGGMVIPPPHHGQPYAHPHPYIQPEVGGHQGGSVSTATGSMASHQTSIGSIPLSNSYWTESPFSYTVPTVAPYEIPSNPPNSSMQGYHDNNNGINSSSSGKPSPFSFGLGGTPQSNTITRSLMPRSVAGGSGAGVNASPGILATSNGPGGLPRRGYSSSSNASAGVVGGTGLTPNSSFMGGIGMSGSGGSSTGQHIRFKLGTGALNTGSEGSQYNGSKLSKSAEKETVVQSHEGQGHSAAASSSSLKNNGSPFVGNAVHNSQQGYQYLHGTSLSHELDYVQVATEGPQSVRMLSLLDPTLLYVYDAYRMRYAGVLYDWGLFDKRQEVLKYAWLWSSTAAGIENSNSASELGLLTAN